MFFEITIITNFQYNITIYYNNVKQSFEIHYLYFIDFTIEQTRFRFNSSEDHDWQKTILNGLDNKYILSRIWFCVIFTVLIYY